MADKPTSADMHPGPGFRVRRTIDRPDAALIEELRQFETPDISDLLNRLYAMTPQIHNLVNDQSIGGAACTVRAYPGDNLMVHKSLDIAQPGDVVVVATGGSDTAVLGDLIAQKAKHRGIAGFVIDGYVRDLPAMREVGLPVFARGVTPVGPLHRGPGELNYSVSCGGLVVNPGDIILGDITGVVVVPRDFAKQTLARAQGQSEKLRAYVGDVKRGIFTNDWVDAILDEAGCPVDG